MSFYTALSGLNAAQTDISVTSNNIANVGTLGFHGSRPEFADIYTSNPNSRPSAQIGSGVEVARIGMDFSQGSLVATGNVLDLSLQGPGFFQVRTGPDAGADVAFTRAGAFNMNSDGFITNTAGHYLTGFPTAENGEAQSTVETGRLRIAPAYGTPTATTAVTMGLRMPLDDNGGMGGQAMVPLAVPFDADDASTYAYSAPVPVLDAEGKPVAAEAFFVMTKAPDPLDGSLAYEVQLRVDGQIATPPAPAATLSFDAGGVQTAGMGPMGFTLGATTLSLDLTGSSATKGDFGITSVAHDGQGRLDLSSVEVRENGTIWASYGAEKSVAIGKVAVANFTDLQGLRNIGSATYLASRESGEVRIGAPGTAGFGAVRSGSVEQANVDLTEELVSLIMAQRNYQASAKALETNGKLSETVMNIRT
ncbi:flagellar hook protein FlgE [Roseovarius aquimarinus]|uniref:Flagellar hook protein FlgE n=1 Tax=Roseovarius aquimarinus TaxID=1229156 RepID=A0ABW7I588_9RHOB